MDGVTHPMNEAPLDREVEVYNPVIGWYKTQHKDGQWPLNKWGGKTGTWYPMPSYWRPITNKEQS